MTGAAPDDPPLGVLYDRAACGLLTTTEDGRIACVNGTFLRWSGRAEGDLDGVPFTDLLEPGERIFYETRVVPVLRLQGEIHEIALGLRVADGLSRPVLLNAMLDRAAEPPLVHLAVFDVSRRQDFERQLVAARRDAEASEVRIRTLQNASVAFGDSVTVEALAHALADSARNGLGAAAAAVFLDSHEPRLAGGTVPLDAALLPGGVPAGSPAADDVVIRTVRDASDPDTAAALRAARLHSLLVLPLVRDELVIGTLACYFSRDPELDDHGLDLVRALCRQAAQTVVRLQLQTQLAAIALYDPLTGLANRVLLRSHITTTVESAIERGQPLALIFVDLDDFKSVNDELDHTAGDTVLKLIAARLTSAVRSEDLVCRYGGDEFIIVCQNAGQQEAVAIAERIRSNIRQPLSDEGWQRTVTASVGVSVHTATATHRLSGPELLRLADKAMYQSKDRGKDRVTLISF